MRLFLTLALATGVLALGAPHASGQAIVIDRADMPNGWYPERTQTSTRELMGAPTDKAVRYPPTQSKTVTVLPRGSEPSGVKVIRNGKATIEQPVAARREMPQTRTKYGTMVVHDPEAFRPKRRK